MLYGWYYIVKPCGYILYEAELYRSEGVRRTLEIFDEAFPSSHYTPEEKPAYIWCDRACSCYYRILNDEILRDSWKFSKFIIDRFHGGNKHKSENTVVSRFCKKYCNVADMTVRRIKYELKYVGLLDENNKNLGNSEAQEQTMFKVGQVKHAVMNMKFKNQKFFLFWFSIDMNEILTRNNYFETEPKPIPDRFY